MTELSLANLVKDNSVAISLRYDNLARDNSVAISSKLEKNSDRIVPS